MAFGDTIGGAYRAYQEDQQQRQNALEASMRNALANRVEFAREHEFGQEMPLRWAAQNTNEAYRTGLVDYREKQATEQARRDALANSYQRDLFNKVLLPESEERIKSMQTGVTPAQRQSDMDFQNAMALADQGEVDSEEHARQLYPRLSPAQAALVASHSQEMAQRHGMDFTVASHMAAALNEKAKLDPELEDLTKHPLPPPNRVWAGGTSPEAYATYQKTLADKTHRQAALAAALAPLSKNPRLASLVTYDPESDSYVPAVPMPRSMRKPPPPGGEGEAPAAGSRPLNIDFGQPEAFTPPVVAPPPGDFYRNLMGGNNAPPVAVSAPVGEGPPPKRWQWDAQSGQLRPVQ